MTPGVVRAAVSQERLDPTELTALAENVHAGAVVTFTGVVRDHHAGQGVDAIDYSAHPDAGKVISQIAEQFAGRDGIHAVCLIHRIGHLEVGDVALVAVIAAEHRGQAFSAAADMVDEVKARLPVWKKQQFTDGHAAWTGLA